MVPLLGRAARPRPGRRGGGDLGLLRPRRGGERGEAPDLRRAYIRGMVGSRPGSAAASPAGHRPRADRGAAVRDFGHAPRPYDGVRVLSFTYAVAGPTVGRTLAEQGADVLGATRPNDYEHEFIYTEANVGARGARTSISTAQRAGSGPSACWPMPTWSWTTTARGRWPGGGSARATWRFATPGPCSCPSIATAAGGPWAGRGGFDMNGSAVSGLMTTEGSESEPRLPVTSLLNDYVTGHLGAVGASAGLVKRAVEGGSWHVTVSLARTAMWCGSLGLVDPTHAGSDDAHSLREPDPYDAASPFGEVHMLAPPVRFSTRRPPGPIRFSCRWARAHRPGPGRPFDPIAACNRRSTSRRSPFRSD